tara:strand:+ start:32 stop:1471 length:1440 start_codon:yes stop_codon:yes gene_type:complete
MIGGGSSPSQVGDGRLIVYSTDRLHAAIRGAGTSSNHANGYNLLSDNYTATESQLNLGVSYSGSGVVLSRSVKVSGSAEDTYLSSQANYSTRPSAFKLADDGSFVFLNTSTNANTAVDSAVTLYERLRITNTGKLVVSTNTNTTVAFDYAALHFSSDNSTVAEGLFINNTAANTGDNASISFSTDSGNRKKSAISHIDTGNYGRGDLVFSIDPQADSGELDVVAHEKLRITSDGKVGIGTNNPTSFFDASKASGTVAYPFATENNSVQSYSPYSHEVTISNLTNGTENNFCGIFFRPGAHSDGNRIAAARISAVEVGDYRADLTFGTRGYRGGNIRFQEVLRLDHNGRFHSPTQPSFHAYNASAGNASDITFSNVWHNIGDHFDASTGVFTCPVNGRYLFTFSFLHSSSPVTYARVLFKINGSHNTRYGDTLCDDTGTYINTSMSMVFNLSEDDEVRLYNEGNNIYGAQYGAFSGCLLY